MKKLIEEYGQALVAIVVAIIFSILVFSFAYPMMAKSSKDTTDRAGRSDWSSRTASALPTIKAAVKPLISANSAYIDYGARFNIKNYVTAYDTNGVSLINNVSIYSITTTKLDNNGKTINVTKKATKSSPLTFDTTKPGTYIVKYQVYARETALSKYVIYSYANAKYVVSSNKKSSTETLDTERFRAYASRYQPKKVVFIASLANAPPDTTDISVAQNDSIQAWMEDDVLYVAQSGGVMASKNCSKLFYSGTVNGWQSKITEIDMSYLIESNITNAYQMFKDCSSLEHIYVYSDWDTTNISTSTEMFKNDFNLQGYQGTTYDDSYTDATRAHLDNGTTQPGYFSVFQIVTKRTNGSATYTGNATNGGAKVEVLNPASGAEVKYGTTRGIYNYTSIPTYTNAGTYVVYFKVTAPKFDDVEGELTIHIEKADSIISTPSAKSLEYNGKAQALINSVTSNHGTIQYKLSTSSTYSSNIPTATNVGTYTVNVKFTPDSNHNSLPVQNVIAKIKKATISYTKEPEANTVTYNGKAQELVTAGKVTNGTLQYSQDQTNWSTNVPTATNAGEYTVYYRTKGNSNYEDTPVEKLVATITKKEVESTVTNGLATYDGNSTDGGAKVTVINPSSGATVKYGKDDENFIYSSIPKYSEVGSYTVYYKVTADNYFSQQGFFTITINPAVSKTMIPTAISGLVYNQKEQKLLTAGTSQDGTFYYSTDYKEDDTAEDNTAAINAATWTTTVPTGKNAGKYNIYWRFAGKDGYSDIDPTLITGEIGKADITINMSSTSGTLTYPNTSISFNVSLSTDEVEYNYVDNVEDEIDRIVTITRNGNNFTLNWVPNSEGKMLEGEVGVLIITNGNENYNFTMNSFKVTTEYGTIKSTSTDGKVTYNGSATNGGAKVTVTEPSTGYTIKYGKTEGTYNFDSIPTYTNAGTHTVYYKISAENYKDKTGKLNIVINKKVAVVTTAPKARDLTYNGSAQALVTAGTTNNGTLQYSLDNKNWSTTIPTGTNAGTYDVYYKVVGDSNHSDSTPVKLTVTIARGTIISSATNGNATYTGNATSGGAIVTVSAPSSGYTIKYGTSSGGYDSATIPTFIDAGTHTVYYQITAPNYSTYNGRFDIIISKAAASITKAPTAKTLTYNGSAQALVNAGTGTGGTFKYSTDNTNWSTTIPSKTAAGAYTVYYKVIGDSNHNDSAIGSVKVTINTKAMKVTATNGSTTYTGTATNGGAKVTVTTPTSGYTVKYGTSSGSCTLNAIPTYVNAGSYTVYYQVTATNYTTFTGSLTITISTKAISISVTNGTAVYSGSAINGGAKVIVSDPSSGATVRYGTTSGTYNLTTVPTYTNAGTYTIYYQVTATNYTSKTGSLTITISKADAKVTKVPTAKTLTYNGSAQELVTAGVGTGGTLKYSTDGTNWSTTIPTKTNTGTYSVYFKVAGDSNHNDSNVGQVTVMIASGSIQASTTNGNTTYTGNATNGGAKVTVITPTSGYTIKYGTSIGGYDSATIPTFTNAGTYTVYYQITAPNYSVYNGRFDIIISKANASVTKAPTAKSLTYSGSSQELVNAGTGTGGIFKYSTDGTNWSTTIPSKTSAGTYTVYYKITGDGNHNDSAVGKVTVTIGNKKLVATVINGSATYTGSATNGGAKLTVTTPSSGATVKYGTVEGAYNLTSIPTYTNAGTYKIYYQASATNYSTETGSLTITINKSNAKVTTSPKTNTLTYTGSSQQLVTAGVGTGGTFKYSMDNTNWTTSIPTKIDAGTYIVYYKVTGDSNHNDSAVSNVNVTISKGTAKVTTTPKANSLTYTGAAQKLVIAGAGTGGTFKYSTDNTNWSTSIPTKTAAGTYTVYYKVTGDSNHNDSAVGSVTVTIGTKAITVTTTNGSATYTGSATNGGTKLTVTTPSSGATVKYGTTSGTYNLTSIPTYTNAGTYTIYYQVTATNYTTKTGTLTITINKASAKVTTVPTAKTLAYTGSSQALVTAGAGTGGTFKYSTNNTNWGTSIPTKTAAGTYTVYYKVTGDDNHNDSSVGNVKVTISKADAKVTTVPKANDLSYTGSSQALVTAGAGTGGTFKYSTDNTNWSTSIPTKTAAGTYTVYYKVTGDENHNDSAVGTVSVTIKKEKTYILASGETVNAKLNEIVGNNSGVKLTRITFTDEPIPDGMAPTTYDLSEKQDGSVIAFCTMNLGDETNYSIVITTQTSGQNVIFNKDSSSMFSNLSMNYIDFLSVDTSNVKTFLCMFKSCRSLYEINNLNNFDTSSAENMNSMFYSCYSLRKVDVSTFDTSNVTTFSCMFGYDSYLTELNVSGFDTGSVTNMEAMFDNCSSLTELDLSSFSTNYVTEFSAMFRNCENLKTIYASELWYTYASIRSTNMFSGCENIVGQTGTIYDSSRTDVSMANYIDGYLTNMNMSQRLVTGSVFKQNIPSTATAISFNAALPNPRYSLIDLSAATDYGVVGWLDSDNVFNISTRRPNKKIEFNENSSGMFMSLGLKNIDFDDNSIDTSRVTDMSYMFAICSSLLSLDLSQFNTVKVTDMSSMFAYCPKLSSVNVSSFNTTNVISMFGMFGECNNLQSLDLLSFDTSKVTTMNTMFVSCSNLTTLDLSTFDTRNVADMSNMFSGCSQINTIYVSALWNTSNVTSSSNMFDKCTNIEGYYSIKYNSSKTDKSMANYTTGYLQEKNNSTPMHIKVLFNNSVRDKITRYVPSNLTFEKLIQAGLFGSAGKIHNGTVSTGGSISTNICYLHKKDSAGNNTYVGSSEYPRTDVTYWYDIYRGE